jgi:hypothetical protein
VDILSEVAARLQELLGEVAEDVARSSGVIVRKRKFTAVSLARTFVLGILQNPKASDEELAQIAVQCGAEVTPQAIDQRHSPKLVRFLKELFCRATQMMVGANQALAPILERFTRVIVLDSSTITLPDELKEEYPGCGGTYGRGQSALKLQTEWDLRGGAITHVEIEPGRSPDSATGRQQAARLKGSLRITDLGYFNVPVFADMAKQGAYFLSRWQFGTTVLLPNGDALELRNWLNQQRGATIDQPILLSKEHGLKCRLIAWRVPEEQANRRRQRLHREHQSKYGKPPSADRLAWCDWTVLVTNVPVEMMSVNEAVILYRARWQVELLFKRWKSQDRVALLKGSTVTRQMVGLWSRLLAALLQHWLVISSAWGDPTKSLSKVAEAARKFAGRLAAAAEQFAEVRRVLRDIRHVVNKTCRRDKRSKPGTFELLNNVSLLDFRLT